MHFSRKRLLPFLFIGGLIWLVRSGGVHLQKGQIDLIQRVIQSPAETITGKIYISPYGSHDAVIDSVSKAKYTISLRGYQVTDDELIRLLINKARLGVEVRLLVEKYTHGNETKDYLHLYNLLSGSKVSIRDDSDLGINFQHAKTIVIDSATFIISSANQTYAGFFNNREHRFISSHSGYAQILQQLFEHDRSKKATKLPALPANLLICPFNCRSGIERLLMSATGTIEIQAQYLEDPALMNLLQLKINQGVRVRLIFGKYQEDNLPSALQERTRLQDQPNVHAKSVLVDNSSLYLGSMNLSTNAMDNNREIGVITTDTQVIKRFSEQFLKDREANAPHP